MSDLRIAVLGVGVMGADHVARITNRISNARVVVVNDYLSEKAEQVAASVPGARAVGDPLDAIADPDVDAVVLATPGPTHEKQLLACLEHGKPVLCEKPLTTDVETSLAVVKREAELGKKLIQVGFMRRFDHEYAQLKALIDGGEFGQPLRAALRPPQPGGAAVVRQRDGGAGLAGARGGRHPLPVRRGDRLDPDHQACAESRCTTGACRSADRDHADRVRQARRRRAVRHDRRRLRGAHRAGRREGQRHDRPRRRAGAARARQAHWGGRITPGFRERFGQAYDTEFQRWVDAVHAGVNVDGPDAWDGYAAAAVCEAGVESLRTGTARRGADRRPDLDQEGVTMKIALDPTPFHHDYELLEFPRLVAELGYEYLQLTPHRDFIPFFNHPRADDDLVAQFRKACADAGVGIASVLPVLRWSGPDEDAREAAVRNWKRVVQITVDLGVNVINTEFSGRPERAEESERAFFRSMEELVPIFEREGIDVRIDPHPDDFVEDGLEALRIIRGVNSPNIGMVFVACHIVPHGRQHGRDHPRRGQQAAAGPRGRHHGPPPQPRPALHHQPAGQPGAGAPAPQDR